MANTKTCKHCGQVLQLQHFYKHAYNKDGLMNVCKACHNKRCRIVEQRNREKRRAYSRKYYRENPDKYKNFAKQYREKYPEKVRQTYENWRKADPMRDKIRHHRRRALKESVLSFKVTAKEMRRIKSQPCIYCGSREKICIDHIVPLSRGGNNSIGNYAPACLRCNSSKKNKLITEWKKVRGW